MPGQIERGFLWLLERWGPHGTVMREKSEGAPSAIDVLCRNTSGGTLTGAAAGSDAVQIDWANFVAGDLPPIKKSEAGTQVLGVVRWEQGSVANGKKCWVRVYGPHPYANVDGTTDVAVGDKLEAHSATAGALQKSTDLGNTVGHALEAYTTNSIAAKDVCLGMPAGMPVP